jgi:hypothetical protein
MKKVEKSEGAALADTGARSRVLLEAYTTRQHIRSDAEAQNLCTIVFSWGK